MKVYNKEGQSMNADKNQMFILLDAGWSTTKLEPRVEPEVKVKFEQTKKPLPKTIKKIPTKE